MKNIQNRKNFISSSANSNPDGVKAKYWKNIEEDIFFSPNGSNYLSLDN